jgi:hypothetical protein
MSDRHIEFVPLGAAVSATLVAIYLLCAVAAAVLPDIPLAHRWLTLFGGYPPLTIGGAIGAIVTNIAVGWLAALVFAPVYNAVFRGRLWRGS